jgi:RND family efflux transporter MFP subunit
VAQLEKARQPYTGDDLAAAQAGVDQARSQLDQAFLGVRDTSVVAPVDGFIAERLVAPGASVAPQAAIVALVPPGLQLVVNVPESRLGQVAPGQSVQLEVAAFPNQPFSGAITSIAPTLDPKTRTAEVRIQPHDSTNRLRAGMFAHLEIVTAAQLQALVVPSEAILAAEPGVEPVVLVIGDDSRVHRQAVQIGLHNGTLSEIGAGLAAGQVVATSRLSDLHDGDLIAARVDDRLALNRSP